MDENIKHRIPLLNDPEFFSLPTTILSEDPPVILIKGLLTPEECQHIINIAGPKLNSSTMILNNQEVVHQSRSSRSAFITRNGTHPVEDAVIHRFLARLSSLTNFSVKNFEGMKVVNYQKGQEYKGHHDFFREHDNFTKGCGDRQLTFFVYLNTLPDDAGGETSFPQLGLKVKPVAGDGVFWVNIDFDGNYQEKTLHAGEPVLTDVEKWGVNIWIRQRNY